MTDMENKPRYTIKEKIENITIYESAYFTTKRIKDEFLRKRNKKIPGTVTYETGLNIKKHIQEIQTAEWIARTFGGNIVILQEKNANNVSYVDLKWNRKIWEVKSPSSLRAIDNRLKDALNKMPKLDDKDKAKYEGIILNIINRNNMLINTSSESIIKIVESRLYRSTKWNMFVIIKVEETLLDVIKVSKK